MANVSKQQKQFTPSSGVNAAYGEAVEVDGATILPVAITSYGFGGGSGAQEESTNSSAPDDAQANGDATKGQAVAGGGFSWPIGAYITRDGYTRFEPNLISLLMVGIPFVCVAGRALRKIIRALKR